MNLPLGFHLLTAALIVGASAQPPAATPAFEQGVVFHAPDVLPAEMLKGPSHRVRDQKSLEAMGVTAEDIKELQLCIQACFHRRPVTDSTPQAGLP